MFTDIAIGDMIARCADAAGVGLAIPVLVASGATMLAIITVVILIGGAAGDGARQYAKARKHRRHHQARRDHDAVEIDARDRLMADARRAWEREQETDGHPGLYL